MPPGGREYKYEELVADRLFTIKRWRREGLSKEAVAEKLGVHTSTLYKWASEKPELKEALKQGGDEADSEVEDALHRQAVGYTADTPEGQKYYPPNANATMFWLRNRASNRWKQNPDGNDDMRALAAMLGGMMGLTPEQIDAVLQARKGKAHGA